MRSAAVALGGILYALALPPFDWACFGWLTLVPLLWVVRTQPVASAFRYGILYGYAFGWAATWCFADAAARYFQMPLPIAVAALAAWYLVVCGLPLGLFAAGSAVLLRAPGRALTWFAVPALWVATEVLRGQVMGQPWDLLGYTQHAHVALIQVAAVTGVYGVSFLLALTSTVVADLAAQLTSGDRRPAWSTLKALAAPIAVIGACAIGGSLAVPTGVGADGEATQVAIVQTNVSPSLHWTRAYTDAQVAAHVRATDALPVGPALIVWPENAVPRYLESEPMLAVQLATLAERHRADLLFGGPRFEGGHTYNAARLITAAGRNGGAYDKRRLVLFAEEKPFVASDRRAPNDSPEEFTAGSGPSVLRSFVPIGVSICHEIVHPDLVRASVRDGAALLVNIANDGWLDGAYGFARRQHLAMSVFRAVESRRFVVRAATTGTSAVIDPYGRLVATQAADTPGIVTAAVAGRTTLTPYVRLGDAFAVLCVLLAGMSLFPRRMRLGVGSGLVAEAPAAS
jgi:apolipoprotein N-acyltransferase